MSTSHPGPSDAGLESGHTDMREHLRTWHGFMQFVKWGIIGNVLILVFLAIFRTH